MHYFALNNAFASVFIALAVPRWWIITLLLTWTCHYFSPNHKKKAGAFSPGQADREIEELAKTLRTEQTNQSNSQQCERGRLRNRRRWRRSNCTEGRIPLLKAICRTCTTTSQSELRHHDESIRRIMPC